MQEWFISLFLIARSHHGLKRGLYFSKKYGYGYRFSSTYDFKRVCDNADGHQLLAVVAAVHHERVGEALDDRALSLSESLCSIAACRVGDIDWLADLNVVTK